jgi:hypothetical protein
MTTHYGKRNPGALTAASPGDTLYIPLAFYNDSGASISIGSTLVAGDIEVFKNGSVTQRATDSGYAILGDTGNFDNRIGFKGISISLFNTADDATFYAAGSTYWVAIDSVTVDGRTVRFWPAVFEIGEPRANLVQITGDTGFADRLGKHASILSASGQIDTGTVAGGFIPANVRQINSDTGAAVHVQQVFANGFNDTGLTNRFDRIQFEVDTGLRDTMADYDTGIRALLALRDTGAIATAVWAGDTGLRDHITNVDTGLTNRLGIIAFDVDTGLRAQISDVDTGLHDTLADYDTGIRALLALRDTGAIATAVWAGDTGLRDHITNVDTGITNRLNIIASDVDTGLRTNTTAIKAKTDSLTFTVASVLDANVQRVNDVAIQGTGDTGAGDTWRPA